MAYPFDKACVNLGRPRPRRRRLRREWLLVILLGLLGASLAVHTAQAFHVSQWRSQAAQLAAQCLGERTPWAGRR